MRLRATFFLALLFVPSTVTMATGIPAPTPRQLPSSGIITNSALTSNFGSTPLDAAVGYVQSWNFAIQRQLPFNFAGEVAYVGNHGVNNQSEFNLNSSLIPGSGNNGRPFFQRFGRTENVTTYLGTHTYYDGFQAKLDRRFSNGLMITTSYTFSKAINFAEDNGAPPTPMNLLHNKGHMSDNRTHVLTESFLYQLPFGRGEQWATNAFASALFGGWQIQGIVSLMSGAWFTPTAPDALLNAPGNQQRPNIVGKVNYPKKLGPGEQFFDRSAFAVPAQNTLGNAGRNILEGPRFMNLDGSVFRDFRVREGMQLTLLIEAFNATNTPHYNNPNADINLPLFGQVNSAEQDQRQLQLALTFRF